jgi:cytochrome c-type biogenesis protein CcmH
MKIKFCLLALCLFFSVANVQAIDPIEFKDNTEEARFQALAKELRCLVCQNESLADSSAGLAQDLRADVITQIRGGKSDVEIKDYMTARYGDFILYSPPIKPRTWLLWFGPFVLLVIGAIFVLAIIRSRSKQAKQTTKNPLDANATKDPIESDWQ